MDVAVGHDLRARADRRGHDQIRASRVDLGARPDRLGYEEGFGRGGGGLLGRCRGGFRGARPAGLRRIGRKAREPRRGGGLQLRRRGILNADQGQGVAVQDLPGLDKFRLLREIFGPLQVEHHWRIQEKPRAALNLLGKP